MTPKTASTSRPATKTTERPPAPEGLWLVRLGTLIKGGPDDDLDAFTDVMLDELLNINPTGDMIGSVETGSFQFWVTVKTHSFEDAIHLALVDVQCAAHAAGGDTSKFGPSEAEEWPEWIRQVSGEAHRLEDEPTQ